VGRHRYVSAKNTYGLELTFDATIKAMGYNARNDEIHENLQRMRLDREAYADALTIVRQFNARVSVSRPTFMCRQSVPRSRQGITGLSSRATLATPSLISI
jgi:hypothetical protein